MDQKSIQKIIDNKYVPTGTSVIRALISAIPYVGGAFDHLIFDKSEAIKSANIEEAIRNIEDKISSLGEANITKAWFESTEALELFRQLIEKIQFEGDVVKKKTLSGIYAISGTSKYSTDPNKFAVLRILSELTTTQKQVLKIVETTPVETRKFESGDGSLQGTSKAKYIDTIIKYTEQAIYSGEIIKSWTGILDLSLELDIIVSFALISKVNNPLANITGYAITKLGEKVLDYLKDVV